MPREEKVKVYKFEELSPEAQKKAIQDWRDKGYDFDDHDAKWLSESFEEKLEEDGFEQGVDVSWGLSYCQGDGVCFKGTIDTERFFNKEGWRTYKELLGFVSVTVEHSSQNCHWNSMSVSVELDYSKDDLIPKDLYEEMTDWEIEKTRIERDYKDKVEKVLEARNAPVHEWEQMIRRYEERKGVLEWLPDKPEKPAPLDIPLPPEPEYPREPRKFVKARERAEEKEKRFEAKAKALEEDIAEWVKQESRDLEKIGYDEIEYKGSDEVIGETLQANEYEYTEDGERW